MTTSNENLAQAKEKIHNLQSELESSQLETNSLQMKLMKGKFVVDKFTLGNDKFYQMLSMHKIYGDMSGVGFDCSSSNNKNNLQKITRTFHKPLIKNNFTSRWTCHFCNLSGHLIPNCPYKIRCLYQIPLELSLSLSPRSFPRNLP